MNREAAVKIASHLRSIATILEQSVFDDPQTEKIRTFDGLNKWMGQNKVTAKQIDEMLKNPNLNYKTMNELFEATESDLDMWLMNWRQNPNKQ